MSCPALKKTGGGKICLALALKKLEGRLPPPSPSNYAHGYSTVNSRYNEPPIIATIPIQRPVIKSPTGSLCILCYTQYSDHSL